MKRSIRGVHFALGIPLVLALAVSPASADEQRPRQGKQQVEPRVSKSRAEAQRKPRGRVPTVAQRKPPAAAQPPAPPERAQPPEPPPPTPPQEIERHREPPPQPMPEPQQPPEQGVAPAPEPPPHAQIPAQPQPTELPPDASCVYGGLEPRTIPERELCSMLSGKAHLQYEEIPGGAAIVLTPKPGYSLVDLRRSIDEVEYALETAKERDWPIPAVQQRCSLFDLYRQTKGLPKVTEGRNMMRLHFTTSKSNQVMPLRTVAYQFACTPPQ